MEILPQQKEFVLEVPHGTTDSLNLNVRLADAQGSLSAKSASTRTFSRPPFPDVVVRKGSDASVDLHRQFGNIFNLKEDSKWQN
jgi:hypothetical protein